jgi:glycerol-3-phosphate cytidylyltransferase
MKNVLTYGTFDLFHYGHERVLSRASAQGDRLFVGVSTDQFNSVKGKVSWNDFASRVNDVQRYVPDAHLFSEDRFEQKVADVRRFKIDVFVMGDDWQGKFDWLRDYCKVVYLPRTPGISSTYLKQCRQAQTQTHELQLR